MRVTNRGGFEDPFEIRPAVQSRIIASAIADAVSEWCDAVSVAGVNSTFSTRSKTRGLWPVFKPCPSTAVRCGQPITQSSYESAASNTLHSGCSRRLPRAARCRPSVRCCRVLGPGSAAPMCGAASTSALLAVWACRSLRESQLDQQRSHRRAIPEVNGSNRPPLLRAIRQRVGSSPALGGPWHRVIGASFAAGSSAQ